MSLPTFPLSLSLSLSQHHFSSITAPRCSTFWVSFTALHHSAYSGVGGPSSSPAPLRPSSGGRARGVLRRRIERRRAVGFFGSLPSLPPSLERASDRERDRRSNPKLFDKFASRNREMRNCPCTQNDMPLAGIRLPRLFSVGIYYLISLYKADGVDGPQEMERK